MPAETYIFLFQIWQRILQANSSLSSASTVPVLLLEGWVTNNQWTKTYTPKN